MTPRIALTIMDRYSNATITLRLDANGFSLHSNDGEPIDLHEGDLFDILQSHLGFKELIV